MGNLIDKWKDRNKNSNICEHDDDFVVITDADVVLSSADRMSALDENCKQLIQQWTHQQMELRRHIITYDEQDMSDIKYIGGVDISFPSNKTDLVHACACLVVLSFPQLEEVYRKCEIVHLTSVYIPHFLAFREVQPLHELIEELRVSAPQYLPQVILVDGNGVLHPRKFGFACHLGVVLNMSTIGVAKKLFNVDGLQKNDRFKAKIKSLTTKGATFDLVGSDGNFLYGQALRSSKQSSNPIYVSIGHKVSLTQSVNIVQKCCMFRIPEPVRKADIYSRDYLRDHYDEHVERCGSSYQELNSYFNQLVEIVTN